jgi:hypothetical protein
MKKGGREGVAVKTGTVVREKTGRREEEQRTNLFEKGRH